MFLDLDLGFHNLSLVWTVSVLNGISNVSKVRLIITLTFGIVVQLGIFGDLLLRVGNGSFV